MTTLTFAASVMVSLHHVLLSLDVRMVTISNMVSATPAQLAAQLAQRSAQEEIDLINKKIKAIQDEAAAKLKALDATAAKENYQLELQKLQLQYQDALARGDTAGAARAQLDIKQLTNQRQSDLARQAIEDAANAQIKPLQDKIESINKKTTETGQAVQDAQYNASNAAGTQAELQKYADKYETLLDRKSTR